MADLDSLVNEILRTARDSAEERKKNAGGNPNISWDDTPAGEAYWKDIRSRNTQLQVGQQNNIAQMARQQLGEKYGMELGQQTGEFGIRGHEITADATRYGADMGLQGREADAQSKIDAAIGAAELKRKDPAIDFIHAAIAADPSIATDTGRGKEGKDKTRMEALLENSRQLSVKPPDGIVKHDDNKDILPSTGNNPNAAYHQPVLPGSDKPPARAALTGGQSMEFPRTDLGPSRESLALAKKKSEENLLYGTKPQKRSWLSAF